MARWARTVPSAAGTSAAGSPASRGSRSGTPPRAARGCARITSPASTETDRAYEEIKQRVCRVGRGVPCGARLDRLGANTVFITVYEHFGSGPSWVEILLHDGTVAAVSRKGV